MVLDFQPPELSETNVTQFWHSVITAQTDYDNHCKWFSIFFSGRISCSPGPLHTCFSNQKSTWTPDPPASTPPMLVVQTYTTMHILYSSRDQTQGFVPGKQITYQLSQILSSIFRYFDHHLLEPTPTTISRSSVLGGHPSWLKGDSDSTLLLLPHDLS